MKAQVIEKLGFIFAGIETSISRENDAFKKELPAFWVSVMNDENADDLPQKWQLKPLTGFPEGLHGIMDYKPIGPKKFLYMIGGFSSSPGQAPSHVKVPPQRVAIFETEPYSPQDAAKTIQSLWNKIHDIWLPTEHYTIAEGASLEVYRCKGNGTMICEVWIPVKQT